VTATKSWPTSLLERAVRSIIRCGTYWVKYTHLAPSDNRSTKSADGRVATEAAWLNGKKREELLEAQKTLNRGRPSDGRHVRANSNKMLLSAAAKRDLLLGSRRVHLVRDNTGFKAASIPGVVYGRTVPLILHCSAGQNLLPTPTEGLKMKSVFHWTFIACENSARQEMKVPSIFRPNALKPKTPTQTKLA
jgi:hypothetical protein